MPATPKADPSRVIHSAYVLGGEEVRVSWDPPSDLVNVALILRHDLLEPQPLWPSAAERDPRRSSMGVMSSPSTPGLLTSA